MASRNPEEVAFGDRFIADLVASQYDVYLPRYARGRLVDLGCGKVPFYAAYRDYADEVICVDWANSANKSEHLDYECDLSQTLPFHNSEFDTILLSDVLEHIPEPEGLWQEMNRILSTDGVVLLNVPFFFRLHEEPYDYYRYTEHALRRFAEKHGFEVLILQSVGGSPEVFTDLLGKHVRFVPAIGPKLVDLVHTATHAFLATSLGKKVSQSTSHTFPLGYFMVARKTSSVIA
jgi:SAM-dependent methyltransferase